MKVKLDFLELIALQTILKQPGIKMEDDFTEMITYGLVETYEDGYCLTRAGKFVLNQHMPYLNNHQNMSQPLGMKYPTKKL